MAVMMLGDDRKTEVCWQILVVVMVRVVGETMIVSVGSGVTYENDTVMVVLMLRKDKGC